MASISNRSGVSRRASTRGLDKAARSQTNDRVDWSEAWALFPGDVAYVWHVGIHAATVVHKKLLLSVEACRDGIVKLIIGC